VTGASDVDTAKVGAVDVAETPLAAVELLVTVGNGACDIDPDATVGIGVVEEEVNVAAPVFPSITIVLDRCCVCSIVHQNKLA
jgi:hypothetical protein